MKRLLLAWFLMGATTAEAAIYATDPSTWARTYATATNPGDLVVLKPGSYPSWSFTTAGVTYAALVRGTAIFPSIVTSPHSHHLTFRGLAVRGSPADGVYLAGYGHRLTAMTVTGARESGVLVACSIWSQRCLWPAIDMSIEDTVITANLQHGIKVDGAARLLVQRVHSYGNGYSGFHDTATDVAAVIQDSEFDHNGFAAPDGSGSGVTVGGVSGTVRGNRIHDNALYGLECWSGCYGTSDRPYVIDWNEVWHDGLAPNWLHAGSGIGVGGYSTESNPPGDARPHHVSVTRNFVHDETVFGVYVLCACADAEQGDHVSVTGNIIRDCARAQTAVARCDRMTDLVIEGNDLSGGVSFESQDCQGKTTEVP